MANHKSAKKRARQDEARWERNRAIGSRVRRLVRSARAALEAGQVDEAREGVKIAERALRRAAGRGVIPAKRASRTISRLYRQHHRISNPS